MSCPLYHKESILPNLPCVE